MNKDILFALTRHFLTLLGGAIAARYAIDGAAIDAASGAILTLVGVAWSIYDKKGK
jgi:hypothetical protein